MGFSLLISFLGPDDIVSVTSSVRSAVSHSDGNFRLFLKQQCCPSGGAASTIRALIIMIIPVYFLSEYCTVIMIITAHITFTVLWTKIDSDALMPSCWKTTVIRFGVIFCH